MNKKLIVMAAVAIISLLSAVGLHAAQSGQCGDNVFWTLDDDGTLTLTGSGDMYDYTYCPWYDFCHGYGFRGDIVCCLRNVIISDGITSIGECAFCRCEYLPNVVIPNSVTKIGKSAFSGCISFTNIEIPSSVIEIGKGVFSGCSNLTNISIPNSVTSIGDETFMGCSRLTNISLPNSIIEIGEKLFHNSGLVSIEIPNSVTKICERAFSDCHYLESIIVPNSVTEIEQLAFEFCFKLTNIEIPNSVASIGDAAFNYCNSLKSIIIPNSMTTISYGTFMNCSHLEKVEIPNSIAVIDYAAFYYCRDLSEIICNALEPPYCRDKGSSTFQSVPKSSCNLYVPEQSIEKYKEAHVWRSFQNINALNQSIQTGRCGNDISWTLDNYGKLTLTGSGDMYDYTISRLAPWYSDFISCIQISDGIKTIGDYAFIDCTDLATVKLPKSIIYIGSQAFANCKNLKEITCEATNPPILWSDPFSGVDTEICHLYIPEQSIESYRGAAGWKDFINCQPA